MSRETGVGRAIALLPDTLDGYIRASYVVSASDRILARIVSDRDSNAYGPFCRRYVRAVDDNGSSWAGSCSADSSHIILRRVK